MVKEVKIKVEGACEKTIHIQLHKKGADSSHNGVPTHDAELLNMSSQQAALGSSEGGGGAPRFTIYQKDVAQDVFYKLHTADFILQNDSSGVIMGPLRRTALLKHRFSNCKVGPNAFLWR